MAREFEVNVQRLNGKGHPFYSGHRTAKGALRSLKRAVKAGIFVEAWVISLRENRRWTVAGLKAAIERGDY